MARKSARASQHSDSGTISQEELERKEPEASGDTPNKSQAARAAIDAGHEKPSEAVAYIKESFGIDMNPQHFSAIKSQYRKKQAKRGRKPKEATDQGVEGYLAPPPEQRAIGGEGDLLAAMEAMKPLVESLGKEQVKRIVDLLG